MEEEEEGGGGAAHSPFWENTFDTFQTVNDPQRLDSLSKIGQQLQHVIVGQLVAVLPVQRGEARILVQRPRGVPEQSPERRRGGEIGRLRMSEETLGRHSLSGRLLMSLQLSDCHLH